MTDARRVIPIVAAESWMARSPAAGVQRARLLAQLAFFVLFVAAPVFDLLRYDLVAGHAWLLGRPWTAGLEDFSAGRTGAVEAALNVLLRVFLPILGAGLTLLWVAWKWGRVYCGWLCPHFSVVETVNRLMRRAIGRHSLWDRHAGPQRSAGRRRELIEPDGSGTPIDARWWLGVVPLAVGFAFLWAVVLLTYLLPPFEVYGNLLHGTLTRNQAIFLAAGTVVLSVEFLFARHLFCRYACAVGLFQSLAWMGNRAALVVGFARSRAADCSACPSRLGAGESACEAVCPMRLNPRNVKRMMFACTQCGQCIAACGSVQQDRARAPLLAWVGEEAARSQEASAGLVGGRDALVRNR